MIRVLQVLFILLSVCSKLAATEVPLLTLDAKNTKQTDAIPCKGFMTIGCSITLYRNGPSTTQTITNNSSRATAFNVTANFAGTALEGAVTSSTCASIPPQGSCTLTFTPVNTAVSLTSFQISGSNTGPLTADMQILSAPITCTNTGNTGCSLVLDVNDGSLPLKITNTSPATITNVVANLTGTALDGHVTQDSSDCLNLLPGATCNLLFNSTDTTVVPSTAITIAGTNSTTIAGSISVVVEALSCTAPVLCEQVLKTFPGGASKTFSIVNSPASIFNATNIQADLASTSLNGIVSVTYSSNCSSLPPGDTCTITVYSSANVQATSPVAVTVQGSNTIPVNIIISVFGPVVGDSWGGGTVAGCSGETDGPLVMHRLDVGLSSYWSPDFQNVFGATSLSDGNANTTAINAVYGALTQTAASRCTNFEIDADGNTPCVLTGARCFNSWFLAAINQNLCIYNALGNYGAWSSTQVDINNADIINPSGIIAAANKAAVYGVMCVHNYVPAPP